MAIKSVVTCDRSNLRHSLSGFPVKEINESGGGVFFPSEFLGCLDELSVSRDFISIGDYGDCLFGNVIENLDPVDVARIICTYAKSKLHSDSYYSHEYFERVVRLAASISYESGDYCINNIYKTIKLYSSIKTIDKSKHVVTFNDLDEHFTVTEREVELAEEFAKINGIEGLGHNINVFTSNHFGRVVNDQPKFASRDASLTSAFDHVSNGGGCVIMMNGYSNHLGIIAPLIYESFAEHMRTREGKVVYTLEHISHHCLSTDVAEMGCNVIQIVRVVIKPESGNAGIDIPEFRCIESEKQNWRRRIIENDMGI